MSDWWSADPIAGPKSGRPQITVTPRQSVPYGEAISGIESGGKYDALGPVLRGGRQALGKYQIMEENLPEWSSAALGRPVTRDEFLNSPEIQDQIFSHRFGQYVQKYGPEGAAKAWFAGEKGMNNPNARDALGTSVSAYADKFNRAAGSTDVSSQSRQDWWANDPVAQPSQAPQVQPEMQGPPQRQVGMGEAIGRGVQQGASFNFSDEIAGLKAASGLPATAVQVASAIPGVNLIAPMVGAGRLGYEALTGQGDAATRYEDAQRAEASANKLAQEQRPYSTMAGNVAGAVALPVGGMMNAATLPARIGRGAAVGAGAGSLAGAGEGEGLVDRATRAVTGGAIGAGIGGAVPVAATGAEAIGRGIGAAVAPVTNRIGGAVAPERQAAKTVVEYLGKGAPELTQAEYAAAQSAGLPVANIDRGGEAGRALARWASNVSPEARDTIQKFADARFEGQGERAIQFLQNITGTSGNTTVLRDSLKGLARIENAPAYRKAFSHPNAQAMWDEGFEQISQAPVVQDAIRAASITGANKGTVEGFQRIRSPFVIDKQTGQLTLRVDENGNRVLPSLQFWNEVKINLDKSGTREAQMLNSALKSHLDNLVPDYRAARVGAARFFDAEDAMDAGQKFVHQNMALGDAAKALAKMSPAERDLFKIWFASKLIDDIGNTRDRVNVLNKIGQSPNAKAKLQMALGPDGYNQLDALMSVEQSMDKLRGALGNSTTVRQMIEIGLAGGVGGSGLINADPTQLGIAAAIAGRRYVDQRVAKEVARMLTSNDPDVLAKGVKAVARNKSLLAAFRNFDARLSGAASQQGPNVPIPGMARADSEQPSGAQRF